MRGRNILIAGAALFASVASPAHAQQRQTLPDFSFSEGVKNGDCKIAFRATDGVTMVDLGLGITDSVFSVDVVRPRWDIVDGKDLETRNLPLTLTFDTGRSIKSEFGGYKSGMYEGLWSLWHGQKSDPIQSQRALEALMNATSATVLSGSGELAKVNLGPKGFAANKLLDCGLAERKKRNM
ncbi:MAG: hypothetical protein EOP61_04620 [Sphingomonadales bacterium]|nr:MAG: hypothetical protein EOP61_04620 [Sphingomonadales bacterium]